MTGIATSGASATSAAAGKSYTAAQVKAHSTPSNCWVILKNGVYNMTAFSKSHSGGAAVIEPVCGKDGTKAFLGQHSSTATAKYATLNQYRIGTLKK
ncbi:MAG: cytochrome b5 domain-containing protein [Actinobacteria bacterium]|nr:cytochrome b5 domain-containing protein [Actinomycetota bacterium]